MPGREQKYRDHLDETESNASFSLLLAVVYDCENTKDNYIKAMLEGSHCNFFSYLILSLHIHIPVYLLYTLSFSFAMLVSYVAKITPLLAFAFLAFLNGGNEVNAELVKRAKTAYYPVYLPLPQDKGFKGTDSEANIDKGPCWTFDPNDANNKKLFKTGASKPFSLDQDGRSYSLKNDFGKDLFKVYPNPLTIESHQTSGQLRFAIAISFQDGSTKFFTISRGDRCHSPGDSTYTTFAESNKVESISYYEISKWPKGLH